MLILPQKWFKYKNITLPITETRVNNVGNLRKTNNPKRQFCCTSTGLIPIPALLSILGLGAFVLVSVLTNHDTTELKSKTILLLVLIAD